MRGRAKWNPPYCPPVGPLAEDVAHGSRMELSRAAIRGSSLARDLRPGSSISAIRFLSRFEHPRPLGADLRDHLPSALVLHKRCSVDRASTAARVPCMRPQGRTLESLDVLSGVFPSGSDRDRSLERHSKGFQTTSLRRCLVRYCASSEVRVPLERDKQRGSWCGMRSDSPGRRRPRRRRRSTRTVENLPLPCPLAAAAVDRTADTRISVLLCPPLRARDSGFIGRLSAIRSSGE